jgi:hypothetical protein
VKAVLFNIDVRFIPCGVIKGKVIVGIVGVLVKLIFGIKGLLEFKFAIKGYAEILLTFAV